MGIELEGLTTNVAAPSHAHNEARSCAFCFFSKRFFAYALDKSVVILVEKAHEQAIHLRAEAKRNSQFDIWQVCHPASTSTIQSVRFNHTSRQTAVGSIAVVMEEGRALLLVPQIAPFRQQTVTDDYSVRSLGRCHYDNEKGLRRPTSLINMRRLSSSKALSVGVTEENQDDYVRTHLGLQLPTWKESARWKSDDSLMNRLEWVPAPETNGLFLIGVGSKVSIWRIVDDAVQVYFQRSFSIVEPETCAVACFDACQSGRFLVTCGENDRIAKVWEPNALSFDGLPNCVFLGHGRSVKQLQWSKSWHTFRSYQDDFLCEMLFCLQKCGTLSIWKEITGADKFVIWKKIMMNGFQSDPLHGCSGSRPTTTSECSLFGLVNHLWTRSLKGSASSSFIDVLLDGNNVLNALRLHYGDGISHDGYSIYNQRSDSIAQMNSVLLGERNGFTADSHAGELVIDGSTGLAKAFNLHLMFSLQNNGDVGFYRIDTCHFTGSSPRVSLAFVFSGMKEQLADAMIYGISCADAKGKQYGTYNLTMEILFQPKTSGCLKLALLKLNAEACSFISSSRKCRLVPYSVQSIEVANMCDSIFAAPRCSPPQMSIQVDAPAAFCFTQVPRVLSNMGNPLQLLRANSSFSKFCVLSNPDLGITHRDVTQCVYDSTNQIVFFCAKQRLGAFRVHGTNSASGQWGGSVPVGDGLSSERLDMIFVDDEITGDLSELLLLRTPSHSIEGGSVGPDEYTLVGVADEGGVFVVLLIALNAARSEDHLTSFELRVRRRHRLDTGDTIIKAGSLPSVGSGNSLIGSMTTGFSLVLWKVSASHHHCSMEPVHRVNLLPLVNEEVSTGPETLQFDTTGVHFKNMAFSRWGRVAVLFDSTRDTSSSSSAQVLILWYFEQSVEDVVTLPQKKLGHVLSIEWAPPVSAESACDLIFLTTNVLGVIRRDSRVHHKQWQNVYHTSRFGWQPRVMSSLAQYPWILLGTGSSISLLSLEDCKLGSTIRSVAAEEEIDGDTRSKVYHAHHPMVLLFLLMCGQFQALQLVLEHIQHAIINHEESCYLNMTEGRLLRRIPLISLCTLLRCGEQSDERSEVYLTGKRKVQQLDDKKADDRAVNMFAEDFDSWPIRSNKTMDRATGLFAQQTASNCASGTCGGDIDTAKSALVEKVDGYMAFFNEHKDSLSFYAQEERDLFLAILQGIKRVVIWEQDLNRKKDEASLRFLASLAYPSELRRSLFVSSSAPDIVLPSVITTKDYTELRGISSEQVVWALLSDHQSVLLQECCPVHMTTWGDMKLLRLPFWVKNVTDLRVLTERVAQAEYASSRDPFHVAIFYVLLGKTKLLANLFKMASEIRIFELLSNNFDEERWQYAAIKNAYVLKTKQRYELSAAFFLLGKQLQEAVAIAEYADSSLVLSFLIARLNENWSFVDTSDGKIESGQLRSPALAQPQRPTAGRVCKAFLETVVKERAGRRGDIYTSFLVHYLTSTVEMAIDSLLTIPQSKMEDAFAAPPDAPTTQSETLTTPPQLQSLYWDAFAQTLLGASEIVRYLRKRVMTSPRLREKAVRLYALTCTRLLSEGLNMTFLFQLRDVEPFVDEFRQEMSASVQINAFAESKRRVLIRLLLTQVDWLCSEFEVKLQSALRSKNPLDVDFCVEDKIEDALQSLLKRGYGCDTDSTHGVEIMLRNALAEYLVHTRRLVVLDFVTMKHDYDEFACSSDRDDRQKGSEVDPVKRLRDHVMRKSTLPKMIDQVSETVSFLSTGNLATAATDERYTKMVDQKCGELMRTGKALLGWLCYYYSKSSTERSMIVSNEFVRIATAAVYSVIGVCSRYASAPCCLYRLLSLIFPHKEPLPKRLCDELKEIATAEVCVHCTAGQLIENPTTTSLQHDLPLLYHVVTSLEKDLESFISEVKTNRLNLMARSSHSAFDTDAPPLFEYCQYWSLLLVAICHAMPGHITKIAVEMAPPACYGTTLARRLVSAWAIYNSMWSKHGVARLLGLFCRSYSFSHEKSAPLSSGIAPASVGINTPTMSLASSLAVMSSTELSAADAKASSFVRNRSDLEQTLPCNCERCPWLIILKMFISREDVLARLNTQLRTCCNKIGDELHWGHLQEPPPHKTVLVRSHKTDIAITSSTKSVAKCETLEPPEKRIQMASYSSMSLAQCIYRSEVSIKSMCFNRMTDTNEMILCASKGICRTACADDSNDTYLFKGMYAHPHVSSSIESPVTARKPTSASIAQSAAAHSTANAASLSSSLSGSSILTAPSPGDTKTPSFKPTAVCSHPFLPMFVSGNQKGQVHLWSYDSLSSICTFPKRSMLTPSFSSTLTSRRDIKKIRFDALGQQMGAVDVLGNVFVWKFSNLEREECYQQFECHDKVAKSLAFLNSGTCLATVGTSSDKKSLCVWDTLLPPNKSLLCAPLCHPVGAASIAFSSTHQLVISGGEGGSISVLDLRQRRVLHTISAAHETCVTTLALHPSGTFMLSGSASGDVKVWSVPVFREIITIPKVHAKPSFLGDAATNLLGDAASNMAINVTNSSWGVTDALATEDYFFSSGTDGSVQRYRVPRL